MTSRYSIEHSRKKIGQILKDCVSEEQIITRNGVDVGKVIPADAMPARILATFTDLFPHATDLTDYTIQLVGEPANFYLEALESAIFKEIVKACPLGILYTGKYFLGWYYNIPEFDIETIRDSLPVDQMWKLADQYAREANEYDDYDDARTL